LGVKGEEARVARQTVHRPLVAVPHVRAGSGEGLGCRAACGAGAAFAGFFGDYGVRRVR
jgi:hypothetical protein